MCVSTGNAGLSERLRHHDARGLVPDAGQAFERVEVARHLAAVLVDEDLCEPLDAFRLAGREAARLDRRQDLRLGELRHRERLVGHREQRGRHEVDA